MMEASGSTFSFTQEEDSQIMSQIFGSRNFVIENTPTHNTHAWEKLQKKHTSLELHGLTLAEYHRVQRIPRGLRVRLAPTLFSDNDEYKNTFMQILNKCSFDLMTLTISFIHKELASLAEQLSKVEQELKSSVTTEEFTKCKDLVEENVAKHHSELKIRKRSKSDRDIEDYERNQV